MKLNQIERLILETMSRDESLRCPGCPLDVDAIAVESRNTSPCGFVADLTDNEAARAFGENVSFRWGAEHVGRVNDGELLGMVVYVDDGRVDAIEAYTFGGRPWPTDLRGFRIERADNA